MTTVQSLGTLAELAPDWLPSSWGWATSGSRVHLNYAAMYRSQPEIRICVDFLARNIAQLGLHVFRRVSDTDRERLTDHGLARLLGRPNYATTRYRQIEWTMHDLGVYGNAIWVKFRNRNAEPALAVLRVPPCYVTASGGLLPGGYEVSAGGKRYLFPPEDVVHFRMPNADNPIWGLSPIETLRPLLEEEEGSSSYRTAFWTHAARPGGIIQRPLEAPEWSQEARDSFAAAFETYYAGADNAGRTVVLEDGMSWHGQSQTLEESQAVEFRKLNRDIVARSYHIPLPMVGILEHATYSNVKEQHKQLYQDSLGPWLRMMEEDIELQVLPEFTDTQGIYVEFNIAEKLAGSFEEQSDALQTAVGRPWMTPDEARARLNLPQVGGDAEALGIPVNIRVGEEPAALPAGGNA